MRLKGRLECCSLSRRLPNHGCRVFQDGIGDPAARKHSRQFGGARLLTREILQLGQRSPFTFDLFNVEMVVGKAGNLGQVGNAKHLRGASELFQPLPNVFCHAAANTGIYLIENKGRCPAVCFRGWLPSLH